MFAISYIDAILRCRECMQYYPCLYLRSLAKYEHPRKWTDISERPISQICPSCVSRRANAKVISLKSCVPRVVLTCADVIGIVFLDGHKTCPRGTSVNREMKRGQRRWNSRTSPLILPALRHLRPSTTRWRFRKHESTTARALLSDSITLGNVQGLFFSPISAGMVRVPVYLRRRV